MEITDDTCRRAVKASRLDVIQGFSTKTDGLWGAPHFILDTRLPTSGEIWRGQSHIEMMRQIEIEKMRIVLTGALGD